jgi:hypothetical protein
MGEISGRGVCVGKLQATRSVHEFMYEHAYALSDKRYTAARCGIPANE